MSLEQFKTQVLLLHSQQSTLDTLSAGFGAEYSVHCATSGTEALNTLGETPIHVIVSAQDLPGMSGLEALREARKRSPDTIGILLAGTDKEDGLEALVGDQEVFQIVRGAVAPDALIELIESANKRVRLVALSESANDKSANVDEPVTEHIVMETSENGSAIISDGTGQMPALKPGKIGMAPGVGGREVDVLVLTKDDEFLATIRDSARGLHNVYHAVTNKQAADIVQKNNIGVLVTDAAMAGSSVEELTATLRKTTPRMVAIVAGRRDDGELLMDLINRGHVYRFLLKPVSPGRARLAIEASVKHHMEAPDEAFRPKDRPAGAPAPKPKAAPQKPVTELKPRPAKKKPAPAAKAKAKAKANVKAAPTPTPTPPSKPAPKPAAKVKREQPRKPAQKIEPTISSTSIEPALDAGLDDAFGESSSFTETMTGIAASVGQSIADAKDTFSEGTQNAMGSVGGVSAQVTKPKTLAIAAGSIAAIGIVAWLVVGGDDPAPADSPVITANEGPAVVAPVQEAAPNATQRVSSSTPVAATETTTGSPPAATAAPYADLLATARAARDAGNIVAPEMNNALQLYTEVVALAAGDPLVQAEYQNVVGQAFGVAETAILSRDADRADAVLAMVRRADPDNPRLTFLSAQVDGVRFRAVADQARLAIREARFDDASALITSASGLAGTDSNEITLLNQELAAAQMQQQVAATIALANERLDAGDLITPGNASAKFYFESALSSDPGNQAAQQGLVAVASKLVLQARSAIDGGQLDVAQALLADARAIDPSSAELQASATALAAAEEAVRESARQAELARQAEAERQAELARQAEAQRLAEIERQAEAERVAAAEREAELARRAEAARQAEAERIATAERAAEAARLAEIERQAELERQAQEQILAERQAAVAAEEAVIATEQQANEAATASPLGVGAAAPQRSSRAASAPRTASAAASGPQQSAPPEPVQQKPQPAAASVTTAAGVSTFRIPEVGTANAADSSSNAAPARTTSNTAPARTTTRPAAATPPPSAPVTERVPISQLTRTNYVGPEYPRAASRRGVTGSVELSFTVTTDGRVRAVSVDRSEPGDTFDKAAIEAVEQWRFQPVIENGVAVEKKSAVRLAFDLQ